MRRTLLLLGPLVAFAPVGLLAGLAALAACGSSSAANGSSPGDLTDAGDTATDGQSPGVIDNGAPSTTYPAPHPPLPDLVNAAKGPVLTTPKVALVFYPGDARAAELAAFAGKVAGSTYWPATTAEYGVGALSYAGMFELTGETAPATITQAQIQALVADHLASGKLGVPDPQTIYTLVFPAGTTITQPNPITNLLGPVVGCQGFTGYHDNVAVALGDAGTKTEFAYAVIPTCSADITSLTSVMSHEWVEAATDPQITANGAFGVMSGPNAAFYATDADHAVWSLLGGGEAGDLCVSASRSVDVTPPDIGYPVQRTWSNIAARASHDPCVPQVAGAVYFAAAPVLPQTVTFSTSFTGTVTTKGIVVPVGASGTVEVDLFSDGALSGPITVKAADLLSTSYGSYGFAKTLDFAWDRTQGVNGEKLHLTVTVTASSFLGGAHAFMITATSGTRRQVWPGLVVEE
jgi:hypothetical protein